MSGTATVGRELRVSQGTWSPRPTSFGYQWQRCTATGNDCANVADATSPSTVQGNKAPSLAFVSLRRIGSRVFVRFRVCDDGMSRITVIERDSKARALSAQRRFRVTRTVSCGSFARNWRPARRVGDRYRWTSERLTIRLSAFGVSIARSVTM